MANRMNPMALHQGDCIQLQRDPDTYQVIGIDDRQRRCWVRRWPLQRQGGSPVFEVSLEVVETGADCSLRP